MGIGHPPSSSAAGPRLELLGTARLHTGGPGLAAGRPLERRDAALLALLALEGPVARVRAAQLLWPRGDRERAGRNLRQRLFRLRRACGGEIVEGERVLALAPSVRHDLDALAERIAADADAAGGELLGALDFADCDELGEWVEAARAQWRARRCAALAAAAAQHEREGRIAPALALAERLVHEDPASEHAHRRVMRLHYLRGDRAAALAALQRCRQFLARELQADPGTETLQLAALIERSEALPPSAPSAVRPLPRPVGLLRPPRLVGRETERQAVLRALADGRAVLVTGEPGMGKSRLLDDLAAAHAGSAVAGARPGDAPVPYALLGRVLRAVLPAWGPPVAAWVREELSRVLPELGVAPAVPLQTLRLHDAVDRVLDDAALAGLRLLLIDDLQFADEASVDWLVRRAGGPGARAPALVLGARSHEVPPALAPGGRLNGQRRLAAVALAPLGADGLRDLLESLAIEGLHGAPWVAPLQRHTGGNPMFVLETLAAVADAEPGALAQPPPPALPLPPGIESLILRRIGRLAVPARRLAQLAALARGAFSVALAQRVLGIHALDLAPAWQQLQDAALLHDGQLAHDLVGESVARSVPAPIARHLHREIAVAAQALGAEPAALAHHWSEAGDWQRAGEAFVQAAEVARARSRRRLEGELAARAAACFERCGDAAAAVFEARARQQSTLRYTERLDHQIDSARRLLDLATTDAQRGVALDALAAALVEDFRHDEVAAAAGQARAIAAAAGDEDREIGAARTESRALGWTQRPLQALALVHRYLPLARRRLDREDGVRAVAEFGCTLMTCDRFDEAAALFEEAVAAALALQDWGLCQECHRHIAWVHDYRGDIEASVASYEASEALAGKLGAEKVPASISRSIFARRLKELGRFDRALAILEEVDDEQRHSAGLAVQAVTQADLAGLYAWLGQPARALPLLRPPAPQAAAFMHRTYHFAAAQIAGWLGRPTLPHLEQAAAWAARESGPFYNFEIQRETARALPPADAASMALQALAGSEAIGLELSSGPLRAVACDALRRAGRTAEAAERAHGLMAHAARRPPFGLYPPEHGWIAHQALAAAGEREAAAAALRWAAEWIDRCALPHVPAAFRDSFLNRNPVNRAVRVAAGRV